jgi:polyhydroxyalkanoate synthesis regulator phasin
MYKKLSVVTLIVLALSLLTVGSVFAQGSTPENPGDTVEGPRGNRPERPFGGSDQRPERSTAVADALGMTPEELHEAVQSGQTIEELAAEKGVDLQAIVLEEFTNHMQTAVEEGRLTQEEADEKIAAFEEKIESGELPIRPDGRRPEGSPDGKPERSNAVFEALGMTPEEVREALQSGQTIEELAAEKGIDLQAIVLEEFTSRMDQAVEDGRLTQEEADEKLAEMTDKIESGEMPFGGHGPQGRPGMNDGPQRSPRGPQDGSTPQNQG